MLAMVEWFEYLGFTVLLLTQSSRNAPSGVV